MTTSDDGSIEVARRVRECMETWSGRMVGAAVSGRSATTAARMSTARAISELRTLEAGDPESDEARIVGDYLRRSRSLLARAAQDIERNRYSVQVMDTQMQRLNDLAKQIFPDMAEEDAAEGGSAEPSSGADDGGADRELPTS